MSLSKLKVGILGCGFCCEKDLDTRLNTWIPFHQNLDIIFSIVSARFKEYEGLNIHQDNTNTSKLLKEYYKHGNIQYLHLPEKSLTEADSRDLALQDLLKNNVDLIWLLDLSDEYYTESQIEKILEYIETGDNKLYTWYSIPFKNYIFDGKQWIDGFCPPRIFRVKTQNYTSDAVLNNCYWDNDFNYKSSSGRLISYKSFPEKKIPSNIINGGVKHLTWLHSNGEEKVKYQMKHFGDCSYKWNQEKKELEFNLDFYRKNGLELPKINKDE